MPAVVPCYIRDYWEGQWGLVAQFVGCYDTRWLAWSYGPELFRPAFFGHVEYVCMYMYIYILASIYLSIYLDISLYIYIYI